MYIIHVGQYIRRYFYYYIPTGSVWDMGARKGYFDEVLSEFYMMKLKNVKEYRDIIRVEKNRLEKEFLKS